MERAQSSQKNSTGGSEQDQALLEQLYKARDAARTAEGRVVELQTKLQQRPSSFSDLSRLYPPPWIIGREAREAVQFDGFKIAKGTQILISSWVVHKDPRWWDKPLEFRPERWLNAPERPRFAYLPFGGGPRVCIGNHFAMMEAMLILSTLLQRSALEPEEAGAPTLKSSITLRPTSHTRMRVRLVDATHLTG